MDALKCELIKALSELSKDGDENEDRYHQLTSLSVQNADFLRTTRGFIVYGCEGAVGSIGNRTVGGNSFFDESDLTYLEGVVSCEFTSFPNPSLGTQIVAAVRSQAGAWEREQGSVIRQSQLTAHSSLLIAHSSPQLQYLS